MKQLVILLGLAASLLSAQAGGVYVSASVPVYDSWGYSYPPYAYTYDPAYAYAYPAYPAYAYEYTRPNYAVSGTLLGALTGGLIGASQCHGWQGAGIGAAAGLLLGSVAEIATEKREARYTYTPVPPPAPAPQVVVTQPAVTAPPPAPRTTQYAPRNTSYAAPSIPDAPRVPDAPTF